MCYQEENDQVYCYNIVSFKLETSLQVLQYHLPYSQLLFFFFPITAEMAKQYEISLAPKEVILSNGNFKRMV